MILNFNLRQAVDSSISGDADLFNDSLGASYEMDPAATAQLLRRTLNLGLIDTQIFLLRLSLFSPISLACLLNDHVSLDTMLIRLERPLSSENIAQIAGCSPILCATLTGACKAMSILKDHMTPAGFSQASLAKDSYGLNALNSLAHILRLQHDHVGQSFFWCDYASVIREDFSSVYDYSYQFDVDPSRTVDGSAATPSRPHGLDSPGISMLLNRSGSGLLQSGAEEGGPLSSPLRPRSMVGSGSQDSFHTPVKKRAPPSARKTPQKKISISHRKKEQLQREHEMKVAQYRQQRKQNGDLHTDFKGGMFSMSGLRFGKDDLENLIQTLTPGFDSSDAMPAMAPAAENAPATLGHLRDRLVYLCSRLQQLAFSNFGNIESEGSEYDVLSLRILRPGDQFSHMSSGTVQRAVHERTVILYASALRTDDKTELPEGYLVEDIVSNLVSQFPSLSGVLAERSRRRRRWFQALRVGRSLTRRDVAVASQLPSDREIVVNEGTDGFSPEQQRNRDLESVFGSVLATYSDAPTFLSHSAKSYGKSVELTLRSSIFLKKMK